MKILLALDHSECSDAATQAVIARYRPDDAEVRVIHVDEWPKGLPASLAFAEGPGAADAVVSTHAEMRRRAQQLITDAAGRLRKAQFRADVVLCDGDAREAILAYAAEWHPDVIVMGSHGRRGLNRLLLGSVSEGVVRHATCSVDVVRAPDGASTAATTAVH